MGVAFVPEDSLGSLRNCLVEGDSAQETRVRRNKQRALLISIVVQVLIVAALVIFPLLIRGERIAVRGDLTPLPPLARLGNRTHSTTPQRPARPPVCRFCAPTRIPPVVNEHPQETSQPIADDNVGSEMFRYGSPNGGQDGFADSNREAGPAPPVVSKKEHPQRIQVGSIEPAMVIHRVEPIYPPLGRQLRREGRVELHAVISTDGAIQSLEVVSGDPLFFQSALAAVREWRYRPTILDGQPVEIDTHISVIYTMPH
jgi:periplasmic protein TonB